VVFGQLLVVGSNDLVQGLPGPLLTFRFGLYALEHFIIVLVLHYLTNELLASDLGSQVLPLSSSLPQLGDELDHERVPILPEGHRKDALLLQLNLLFVELLNLVLGLLPQELEHAISQLVGLLLLPLSLSLHFNPLMQLAVVDHFLQVAFN